MKNNMNDEDQEAFEKFVEKLWGVKVGLASVEPISSAAIKSTKKSRTKE